MNYNPRLDKLLISTSDAQHAYFLIREALKDMRKACDLPLDKYERSGPLTMHDHAALSIMEVATTLGIDMGAGHMQHNTLDLRESGSPLESKDSN